MAGDEREAEAQAVVSAELGTQAGEERLAGALLGRAARALALSKELADLARRLR